MLGHVALRAKPAATGCHNAQKSHIRSFSSTRVSRSSTARGMTRSKFFAPIHWDAPNDAVITSHKLLVQAGFVKKVRPALKPIFRP